MTEMLYNSTLNVFFLQFLVILIQFIHNLEIDIVKNKVVIMREKN